MQHYKQGFLPISFNNIWISNEERRAADLHIILRNSESLNIPFARLTSSLKQPYVNLPKTWMEFTNSDITIIRDKIQFNVALKKHLLNELSAVVLCNQLLCPVCHLSQ